MSETIQQKRPTLSYEIFPPNTQVGDEKIITVLDELKSLKPEFISVTCSNKQRNIEETTIKLSNYVQNTLHIPTKAHLPAIYLSKEQVRSVIDQLDQLGIHKLLALRGDILEDLPPVGDFKYINRGVVCSLGHKDGIADVMGGKKSKGFKAAKLKKIIEAKAIYELTDFVTALKNQRIL